LTRASINGATLVAGVVGAPVTHSLSPLIHNAWLDVARCNGVYVPFSSNPSRFESFVQGMRGGALRGLNVTLPFKQRALELADTADLAAKAAGAANLLLFHDNGSVEARNTDGIGLLAAFAEQAPQWRPSAGPVVMLGAGGAARGAVAALVAAGAIVRVVNRNMARAQSLSDAFPGVTAQAFDDLPFALENASAFINAAPLNAQTGENIGARLEGLPSSAVVMDMVYTPLETPLLWQARRLGLATVDGLAMLIGQAKPSFEALFGAVPPTDVDVRHLAEHALRTPS
jgi:shikimate dehydrogenase